MQPYNMYILSQDYKYMHENVYDATNVPENDYGSIFIHNNFIDNRICMLRIIYYNVYYFPFFSFIFLVNV